MITIIFEGHADSVDTQPGIASGHVDVPLSEEGKRQAHALGERYRQERIDLVCCSDLQRSYRTAELAFGDRIAIIRDRRLRECDYGDWTRRRRIEVAKERERRIGASFPNGESYQQVAARVRSFLHDLLRDHDGKTIMVIGHRATHDCLEHLINDVALEDTVAWPRKEPAYIFSLDRERFIEEPLP